VDIREIRAQIPALGNTVYLNAGGIGPNPKSVGDALADLAQRVAFFGPDGMAFQREEFTQAKATRARLAAFFGVDNDEITLVRSTAEGFDIVGHGLEWHEGDEVIFGAGDHPAARAIWTILAQRHGIKPVKLELRDVGPDEIVDDIRRLISPRTRMISISHVTSENGLCVPARKIADLAHAYGAFLMLDGCQAVGQFPINPRELGADFYSAGTYKWLLAPFGTGFLWMRKELLDAVRPSWVGAGGTVRFDPETAAWEPLPTGERYEFGARYWPVVPAMKAAVEFVDSVGFDFVRRQSRLMADRMRSRLAQIDGAIDFTPSCDELRTGMVGAAVKGMEGRQLMERLRARNIHLRANRGPDGITGVRLCLAFFSNEDDVDCTADAIADAAAVARAG
jgi:selenocysteine lyase/cysteine desulfurase